MSGAEGQSPGIGSERQFEICVGGARGTYSDAPVSFERLERAARRAMTPEGFAYVAGGGSIATMDDLPAIVDAVGGRLPVLLDSGIRSGADEFRALVLGAAAVGLGRPKSVPREG